MEELSINDNEQENNNGKVQGATKDNVIKKKTILNFITTHAKKTITYSNSKSEVATTMKQYGYTFYNIFHDIGSLIKALVGLLYSYTFGLFSTIKAFKEESKKAAKNHFHIGLEMLKVNNLLDARIRFLMSNMFFKQSPTTKYYIAYTYYLSHNYKKSLKYIKEAININNKHQRSIELMKRIEQEINNGNQIL